VLGENWREWLKKAKPSSLIAQGLSGIRDYKDTGNLFLVQWID